MSESQRQVCDGPNCSNEVGLLLLADVAVIGPALGKAVFCCDACAEEWLDRMQAVEEAKAMGVFHG